MPFFSVIGFTGGSLNGRWAVGAGWAFRKSSSGKVRFCGCAVCTGMGVSIGAGSAAGFAEGSALFVAGAGVVGPTGAARHARIIAIRTKRFTWHLPSELPVVV